MTRQDIIERVKIVLDEFTPVHQGVVHPIDTYIDPILDDAVRRLLNEFPLSLLGVVSHPLPVAGGLVINGNRAVFTLPSSVLRVGTIQLSGWPRPVYEPEIKEPTDISRLWQLAPGITATPSRPRVFIHRKKVGLVDVLEIECFGISSPSASLTRLDVVSMCAPEDLDESLITPFSYLIGSLVALFHERVDMANAIYSKYSAYILTAPAIPSR